MSKEEQHENREDEITVEALLRLKRAERPDAAFWDRFDRELHQRMLRTLVKKDPWYVQVGRGLSGRYAQSVAVASAAALLALLVVRPAWVPVGSPGGSAGAVALEAGRRSEAPSEVAMADLAAVAPAADYGIDSITAADDGDAAYRRDFGMDAIQVASGEVADYSGDLAGSWPALGSTGVASLVY